MITQLHDALVGKDAAPSNLRTERHSTPAAVTPSVPESDVTETPTTAAATEATETDDVEGHDHLLAGVPPMSDQGVKDLVKVFKLLSDETRLRILLYLTRCPELHVRALCDRLGQSQPAVSHHLALLRVAGLIESRREGKHNFYHLVPHRFEQLLEMVFETVPGEERQIRLQDYVLRYAPQSGLV